MPSPISVWARVFWWEARRKLHNFKVLRKAEKAGALNLYLDDTRYTTLDTWYHAATALEAKDILSTWVVEHATFDHDLGPGETGYNVVLWLASNLANGLNFWPKNKPLVHSANPVGRANMQSVIDRYGPY